MSSKKEKKRYKADQKVFMAFKQQKLHHEEYQIPPYSQEHLRALFLEYISRGMFQLPIHHEMVMNKIKSLYQNIQNSDIYMKELDLAKIIRQLVGKGFLQVQEYAYGTKLVLLIEKYDLNSIMQLAMETRHQRPMTQPPDPISFQQQKKMETQEQKQLKKKVSDIVSIPTLCKTSNSYKQIDHDYISFEQKKKIDAFKNKNRFEYCENCTRDRCLKILGGPSCTKKHFRALITNSTDESMGNCPHLNACHNPDCKHIHYSEEQPAKKKTLQEQIKKHSMCQWINCNIQDFDFSCLGKFDVIMADPPWDIHMNLPYQTMKDKDMLNLRVDLLQDDGVIFLWVTGRAMELARQCMDRWGYKKVDELVWIKTNQIQRLIITGKTGHWLNHSKQHCLVGIKGKPNINAKVDCDVIVSQVRQTSRKPDQIYGLIERMHPGGRKIELFGRPQNCMPGWMTLGNQLPEEYILSAEIRDQFNKAYPHKYLTLEKMKKHLELMTNEEHSHLVYNNHILKNA